MQQQQRRCGAPRCSAAGIAEAIVPIVGIADHQPNLATHVPEEKEEGEGGGGLCEVKILAFTICMMANMTDRCISFIPRSLGLIP